jgi:hypothetical protein
VNRSIRFQRKRLEMASGLRWPSESILFIPVQTMRTLAAVVVALISASAVGRAGVVDKLIGKWSGTASTVVGGTTYKQKTTEVFKRFETTGLIVTTTTQVPGQDKFVGVVRYHKSGKIDGSGKASGFTSTASGKWSVTATALKSTIKWKNAAATVTVVTTETLQGKNKYQFVSTVTPGGVTTAGPLTRK